MYFPNSHATQAGTFCHLEIKLYAHTAVAQWNLQ